MIMLRFVPKLVSPFWQLLSQQSEKTRSEINSGLLKVLTYGQLLAILGQGEGSRSSLFCGLAP